MAKPNIEKVMCQSECVELAVEPASDSYSIYTEMAARYLAIEAQLERQAK